MTKQPGAEIRFSSKGSGGSRFMLVISATTPRPTGVIIDACIPFRRKKTFPVIARSSKALDDRIREKWAKDLPKGF